MKILFYLVEGCHSHQAKSCHLLDPLYCAISEEDSKFIIMKHLSPNGMLSLKVECEGRVCETNSGPFNNPFMTFFCSGQSVLYKFWSYFILIKSGLMDIAGVSDLLNQMLPDSGYVTCLGISGYPSDLCLKLKTCVNGEIHLIVPMLTCVARNYQENQGQN